MKSVFESFICPTHFSAAADCCVEGSGGGVGGAGWWSWQRSGADGNHLLQRMCPMNGGDVLFNACDDGDGDGDARWYWWCTGGGGDGGCGGGGAGLSGMIVD